MTAETALHSKAFNFMSYLQGGVDPRTGQYTFSIALRETQANDLQGPGLPLTLFFNPLNQKDSGYGRSWNLQLSQYNTQSKIVTVHSGESFAVTPPVKEEPWLSMSEKKIDSFHLEEFGPDTFRLVHRSGLVEILKKQPGTNLAMPTEVYSEKGHGITLVYAVIDGAPRLASIRDQSREIFKFTRESFSGSERPQDKGKDNVKEVIRLVLNPGASDSSRAEYQLELDDNQRVASVRLPTANDAEKKVYPYWRLSYTVIDGFHCIDKVRTPLGARETVSYSASGKGHEIPNSSTTLPRVLKHEIDPGSDQPKSEVRYDYTLSNDVDPKVYTAGNNFLGAGLDLKNPDTRLDYLYRYTDNYLYGSIETRISGPITRTVERRFNRFHLLELERTRQVQQEQDGPVTYTHDTTTRYDIKEGYFEQQTNYCQLPLDTLDSWTKSSGGSRNQATTQREYYADGNLKSQTEANGVRTVYEWYSADGEGTDCPKDAEGFNRHLKSTTTYPDPQAQHKSAKALYQHHRYQQGEPLATAGSQVRKWHRVMEENLYEGTSKGDTVLQTSSYEYFDMPTDGKLHGRVKVQKLTLNELTTTTTYEYKLKESETLRAELVLVTTHTVTGHDHKDGKPEDSRRKSITSERSLFSGEPVLVKDHNGIRVQIEQNELGQVIAEIVAPGEGAYEARRTYSYTLCPNNGSWDFPEDEQVSQSMTNARGVNTITYTDGLGRPVREERDHIDERNKTTLKNMMETVTLQYDALGQKTRVTVTDYRSVLPTEAQPSPAPDPLTLTSWFSYDGWGQECCIQGPDQTKRFTDNDPTGQGKHDGYIRTEWTQSPEDSFSITDLRQTWLNLFDKPDQVHRLDARHNSIAHRRYEYDGVGNTKVHVNERGHFTAYDYDAWGRMTRTTLADGTQVNRSYAKHSSAELPIQVYLDRELGGIKQGQRPKGKPVVLGDRSYDGIDRLTDVRTGERKEELLYATGGMQPTGKKNSAQQEIKYEYDLQLREAPTGSTAPDDTARFTLNKTSALLELASSNLGERRYEYDSNSRTRRETWKSHDGTSQYSVEQGISPLGRLSWQKVEARPASLMTYNDRGQLKTVSGGDLHTDLEYDTLGRLRKIKLENCKTNETLATTLEYDNQGREEKRTFTRTAQAERTLSQEWWPDGLLKSRHLQEGQTSLLKEDFKYDNRGRLTDHECSGRDLPQTPQRHKYTKQKFEFDDLDNIISCVTYFADGKEEIATFHYENDDPCQLTRVTYVPPRNGPPERFTYDANGCQTIDEQDRAVKHDSQRRLKSVSGAGQRSGGDYGYDAHGHLTIRAGTTLYFQGNRLRLAIRNAQTQTQLLYAGEIPLGQQDTHTESPPLMFSCNASGSVIADSLEAHARYSAYGECFDALSSLLGFNGESLDPVSGWYLLGLGHRAYNPTLMRFLSPDSLSPFDSGGINCYAYCQGNPITFRDPTGRSRSLGEDGSRSLGSDGHRTLEMTPEQIWEESMRPRNSPWKSLLIGAIFTALAIVGAVMTVGASLAPTIAAAAAAAAAAGTTLSYGSAFAASALAVKLTIAMAVAGAVVQTVSFGLETAANFGMTELYKPLEIFGYTSMLFAIGDSVVNGALSHFTGGPGKIPYEPPPGGVAPRGHTPSDLDYTPPDDIRR